MNNGMVLSKSSELRELALFAGAGGGILGGMLLGWRTVAAVEIEDYPRRVLLQRQADGILPKFPIWDDVCTFDGKPWRGKVDVISGGFPCQDISSAGKGKGITGERSGLWKEMARIIGEVRPKYAFVENSPMLVSRGLTTVLSDLSEMGYDARWGIVGAGDVGANHQRNRMWIRAYSDTNGIRLEEGSDKDRICNKAIKGGDGGRFVKMGDKILQCKTWMGEHPAPASNVNMVDGVADRVGKLKSIGNGQVPAVAALAWETLNA